MKFAFIAAENAVTNSQFDVNFMCRELGKKILERGSGSIVNISSVAGSSASRTGRRTTRASTDS